MAAPVFAQTAATLDPCRGRLGRAELTETTSDTYYRFFVPGDATVQVNVEGAVQQPGLYEVGVGTNLGRLLALSGGPRYEARESSRRRRVEVRLYRPNAGAEPIYATTLQDTATNPDVYPDLCEGDTMLIDVVESRRFGWQEIATIAGGVSAVALLVQALGN
ncbi:MAG: hypothetical protein HKN04_00370 [Rhodothermaceae bacterium]|nr:hypothetical protein [Rhodothermaceae bacterium]